jgi:hypothetical protein
MKPSIPEYFDGTAGRERLKHGGKEGGCDEIPLIAGKQSVRVSEVGLVSSTVLGAKCPLFLPRCTCFQQAKSSASVGRR